MRKSAIDQRIAWLEAVKKGETTVGLTALGLEPTKAVLTVVITSSSPSPLYSNMFTRDRLRTF